jgi:hypothetical protein
VDTLTASLDELTQYRLDLDDQIQKLKELKASVAAEINKRNAVEEANFMIANLDDVQKAALLQQLTEVGAIEPPEF